MSIAFDPAKDATNLAKHGITLSAAADFEFETALFSIDARHDYGEVRYTALGLLRNRLHALVFTETSDGIRVISLRKANSREQRKYLAKVQATGSQ